MSLSHRLMVNTPAADWSARCRTALAGYAEPLLRSVAARLVRPRGQPRTADLLDKAVATLGNPPVVDRRIRDLSTAARRLLAVIGMSRQPRWKVAHLLTTLAALGHADGFAPVEEALGAGLLFPVLSTDSPPVEDFPTWLGRTGFPRAEVFAHPAVVSRARGEPLGLPDPTASDHPEMPRGPVRAADGWDWPLRLAVVWQQVRDNPVRVTQANTLFKKDLARLQTDEVLSLAPADLSSRLAEPGVLALLWAQHAELLTEHAGELTAGSFPAAWNAPLPSLLGELLAAFWRVEDWDPLTGYAPRDPGSSATPTAALLALLLLANAGGWVAPSSVADWLWSHHPTWAATLPLAEAPDRGRDWVTAFLFGVAYPLQLVEVADGTVRLAPLGRHLLTAGPPPADPPPFPQTLLVQPNTEILAYRQGFSPALLAGLSQFARWKWLGPACTLELTPEHTYRGLESGLTLPALLQTLNRHSARPVPPAVTDLLRRWASKRERITVFSSAVLVEFATPAELDAALARGIVAVRLTDRIGTTADGSEPALTQLRLIANRDYQAKPQRCVTVEDDGVTLTVDVAAADLLLDAELARLATPLPAEPTAPRRFRLDPRLLRQLGPSVPLTDLETWFIERTGRPLPPAARLLLLGPQAAPLTTARLRVVRFPTPELADGAFQWPDTRLLLRERLGPTTAAIDEETLPALRAVLAGIGVNLLDDTDA